MFTPFWLGPFIMGTFLKFFIVHFHAIFHIYYQCFNAISALNNILGIKRVFTKGPFINGPTHQLN